MLLLILAICIAGIILPYIFMNDDDFADVVSFIFIVGSIISFVTIIITLCSYIGDSKTINPKIEMYQEENTAIEEKMDALVKQYMNYEKDTFKDLKVESSITLVSLYPELKSDELIKQQLDTYLANNNKIKELKEAKYNLSPKRWWLYFGK